MQLNFVGLILLGVGVVLLGLGISGNYGAFGRSLKAGVTGSTAGSEATTTPQEPGGGTTGGGGGSHGGVR